VILWDTPQARRTAEEALGETAWGTHSSYDDRGVVIGRHETRRCGILYPRSSADGLQTDSVRRPTTSFQALMDDAVGAGQG